MCVCVCRLSSLCVQLQFNPSVEMQADTHTYTAQPKYVAKQRLRLPFEMMCVRRILLQILRRAIVKEIE